MTSRCPLCGTVAIFLRVLGSVTWYRCSSTSCKFHFSGESGRRKR